MKTHDTDPDDRTDSEGARRRSRGDRSRRRSRRGGPRERKERVLHTRISDQLAEDIRQLADDLRVPASNLVRNVLEEVFTMVDSVSDDVGDLMDDLIDEAEGVRDRVRRQRSSHARRAAYGRRRHTAPRDEDVERELREDEARDAGDGAGPVRPDATRREADAAAPESERAPDRPTAAELFPDVLGWQPLVLNRDGACGRCDRPLRAGESAFLGMTGGGLTETALCGRCVSSGTGAR